MSILNYFQLGEAQIARGGVFADVLPALVYGDFAITRQLDDRAYTITIRACGRSSFVCGTLEEAARIVGLLNGIPIDWTSDNIDLSAKIADLYGDDGARRLKIVCKHLAAFLPRRLDEEARG